MLCTMPERSKPTEHFFLNKNLNNYQNNTETLKQAYSV